MQELRVVGVRVELPGNQPILLLKETQGERYLPIWIGAVEAAAIAFEQQGVRPARPMTHDLLREVVRALGATLEAVNITEMRDGIYIAELVFGTTSGQGGLGWYIFEAKNLLNIPEVFAGLLSIILIGLFIENVVFRVIEARTIGRWGMQN